MSDDTPAKVEADNRGSRSVAPRPAKRLDVAHALKLRMRGWTFEDIGRKLGFSSSRVHSALARFRTAVEDPDGTRAFRENEVELLDDVAARIVAHMGDEETIGAASLNNAAFALGKVFEARRLIRDQSTSNVGIHTTLVLAAHGGGKALRLNDSEGDGE